MAFAEVLAQVLSVLRRAGWGSYKALTRHFHLGNRAIDGIKDESIAVQQASARATLLEPVAPIALAPKAERRQLTVMFCDLVESTPLSGQLDPEDFREIVQAYHATCAEIIQHFDGYIAQYLGDGLLVYYGYPRAHEDGAQRAVHTGLGILEAMTALNARLQQTYGVRLALRIGIHTGLVVVGESDRGDRHEPLAWGETPNIAARIEGLAAANTMLLSEATYRLIRGYFLCEGLGSHTLRGVVVPMHLYRVVQASVAHTRFDVALTTGLTALVGREEELALLQRCWEHSQAGCGQVVALSGEAGIGKSRLIEEWCERVRREGHAHMVFRCSPYHTHSAFYAVIDYLQRAMTWQPDDASEDKLAQLEDLVQACDLPLGDILPAFAVLLSVPLSTAHHPFHMLSPQQQKQQTQEAIVAWLLSVTARQPLFAVWEDLHWADPSTLELLSLVMPKASRTRMLTLFTFRPEFVLPWASDTDIPLITLGRLESLQVQQMVAHLMQGKSLPPEILEQVIAKTDGVPLFVEELLKMVLESDLVYEEADHYALKGLLSPLAIPVTLQDSLMARLDRVPTVREVAQLGAVLGREFAYELIQAVSPMDVATLQQSLAQLVAAELIYQQGVPPRVRYVFKHALVQETAYQSLLRSTRQHYHARIAQVLAAEFPTMAATQPELLAYHYTEARLYAQAIPYWLQAGRYAIERSANLEAMQHLNTGLEVLARLPATPERAQQELTLQLALGAPLWMIKGNTAPEVQQLYRRAQELCQQIGEVPQRFAALAGLWRFYLNRAQLQRAHELADQCFLLAQRLHDAVLLQEAHLMLGSSLFYLGAWATGHRHLEHSIALYDREQWRTLAVRSGLDPGVVSLARSAWTLWMLGYPDQALARGQRALALAQELSHAYSTGFALHYLAIIHQGRREVQHVQEWAEATITLGREQRFVQWIAAGMCMQGWAQAEQGAIDAGIARLREGIATWLDMGTELARTHMLFRLAEAYWRGGYVEAGLQALDEALVIGNNTSERYYEAEVYRLKGELLMVRQVPHSTGSVSAPSVNEAEASLLQALDIARQQETKSLELRAIMSLCRLWQRQPHRRVEGRDMLAEVYAWFHEGFETPDLQEAQALLARLE